MVLASALEGTWEALGSVTFVILVLCFVLFLAYLTTKWLAKRTGGASVGGNIKIIERQYVGQDRSIVIVQVEEQTMLLGITPQQITKLADLDGDALIGSENPVQPDFSAFIRGAISGRGGRKGGSKGSEGDKSDGQ